MQKHPQEDSENKSEGSDVPEHPPALVEISRMFVFLDLAVDGREVGRIVIELLHDIVPRTCENFRQLCKKTVSTSGKPLWYKNTSIFNIRPGFMIQGGDVNGKGGESIYGPMFEDENFDVKLTPGTLGMVNTGPNTNSSQFFVSLVDFPHLQGQYVGFGKIVKGIKVLHEISFLPSIDSIPKNKIVIVNCGELPSDPKKWNYIENDGLDQYPPYPEDWEPGSAIWAEQVKEAILNIKEQGNNYLSISDYEKAIRKYDKAMRYLSMVKNVNEEVYNECLDLVIACQSNLAKAYISVKNFRPAHELCSEVLRMKKHAKAYFRRGQANYGLHNYDAALDDLSEALQLEPSDKLIRKEIENVKLAKIHARCEDKERFANMLK